MKKIISRKFIVSLMAVSLMASGLPSISQAEVIDTQTLLKMSQSADARTRVEDLLSRQSVHDQMIAMGADPVEVQGRIDALTEDEIRSLEAGLSSLPAGSGVLGIVGATFIVLLILEITGVIDIFKKV